MLTNAPGRNGGKGTIVFTNASAAIKGYAKSGAFAMASHAKLGLAESMARELMPEGIACCPAIHRITTSLEKRVATLSARFTAQAESASSYAPFAQFDG